MVFNDTNLLRKGDVSYGNLQEEINRVKTLVESIDLSSPISARLMLVATCIEATALHEDLLLHHSIVINNYMPSLVGKPSFIDLGKGLLKASEKLYMSDITECFRIYDSFSIEGYSENKDKDTALKIQTVDIIINKAEEVFNKLKCYFTKKESDYKYKFDLSKVEVFSCKGIPGLIELLSGICYSCYSECNELSKIIDNPSFYSLKNGLKLNTDFFLKSSLPNVIKHFNIDRERALDEYDENSMERITEEIKYLQEKKKEIQINCNKEFFDVWKECMDSKTNAVNYEAVIYKLRPNSDDYVEDIMNEARLESNLKEVYLYDYITSEIKNLKVIQRQIQEPKEVVFKQEVFFNEAQLKVYKSTPVEQKGQKQVPEKIELKSFKKDSDFLRNKVKKVIDKFYSNSAANLALIETVFFDHDLLKKNNNHTKFLKDLVKMNAIIINDEEISKMANGMSVKKKNLPKKGYKSWPDTYQNDKKTCKDIGEELGPTIKYNGLS